jgi:hypothetical protein
MYFDADHAPPPEVWERWITNASDENSLSKLINEALVWSSNPQWAVLLRLADSKMKERGIKL